MGILPRVGTRRDSRPSSSGAESYPLPYNHRRDNDPAGRIVGASGIRSNAGTADVSKSLKPYDYPVDATARESEEIRLVRRAQAGEAEAFAELVRRYQRRAVSVAYRLLGNIEDASDVSQDAFVRAYQNLSQLEDPSRFGGWLMKVVSNLSLNFRRARSMRATARLDDEALATVERLDPRTNLRATTDRSGDDESLPEELHGAVSAALDQLPRKQRLALVLFSVEGMPQKEVAEILDCSIELVKWNVFQARKKLKEMLAAWL